MGSLIWILTGGLLMSLIALVGAITAVLSPRALQRVLLPMVALAAGTLLGGAFFHMIPEVQGRIEPRQSGLWVMAGFTTFLALEQLLFWHHSHRHGEAASPVSASQLDAGKPMGVLILLGDGLHNFIGGLSIASAFLLNPTAGVMAWLAAAAHEVPQELGDIGVLLHCGWSRPRALAWNFLSALTFPLGGLLAYGLAPSIPLEGLVLFGAGNFVYIAASDLVPEIKARATPLSATGTFLFFLLGLLLMLALAH